MLLTANVVGEGAEGKDIPGVPERHAIFEIQRSAGENLIGKRSQADVNEISGIERRDCATLSVWKGNRATNS